MIVTGLNLRGDSLAVAVINVSNGVAQVQHAEVIQKQDAADVELPGKVVLVASAEATYRASERLTRGYQIPNERNYINIVSENNTRPGGNHKSGALRVVRASSGAVDRDMATVALTNLDAIEETRKHLTGILAREVGAVDPAASWLAYFEAQGMNVPEIFVDDLDDPAQLVTLNTYDAKGKAKDSRRWITCEVDAIPKGSTAQRASAVASMLQKGYLTTHAVHQIVVSGRLAGDDGVRELVARLGGAINVIPFTAPAWALAAGAALVGAHFFGSTYEEVRA